MNDVHRKNYAKGIAAGFVATVVLSAIMFVKGPMGIMPQLNPIQMIADMVGGGSRMIGWMMHFMIGTVAWGLGTGTFVTAGAITTAFGSRDPGVSRRCSRLPPTRVGGSSAH